MIRTLSTPSAVWVAFVCGLAVRSDQPLQTLVLFAALPLSVVWSVALLSPAWAAQPDKTPGDQQGRPAAHDGHDRPASEAHTRPGAQRAAWPARAADDSEWMARETRSRMRLTREISIGLVVAVLISLGALVAASGPDTTPDEPRTALTNPQGGPAGAALLGYHLGARLSLPECHTEMDGNGRTVYSPFDANTCFKYFDAAHAGQRLSSNTEWLIVDRFDSARHFADVNGTRPVCLGVTNGAIQAVAMHVANKSIFETDARTQLGGPTQQRSWQVDRGDMLKRYDGTQWLRTGYRLDLINESRLPKYGHGLGLRNTVAIISSTRSPAAIESRDTYLGADCPELAGDALKAGG